MFDDIKGINDGPNGSKITFKRKDLNPIKPTIFSWIAIPNSRVLKKQIFQTKPFTVCKVKERTA